MKILNYIYIILVNTCAANFLILSIYNLFIKEVKKRDWILLISNYILFFICILLLVIRKIYL